MEVDSESIKSTNQNIKMDAQLTAKQIARIERIRAERAFRRVDERDYPNIFPYKKCAFCSERSSCGNYDDENQWVCEDCQ